MLKDQLAGQHPGASLRIDEEVGPQVDITHHGGPVLDEEPLVPPAHAAHRDTLHGADQAHVLAADDLLEGGGGGHRWDTGQLSVR